MNGIDLWLLHIRTRGNLFLKKLHDLVSPFFKLFIETSLNDFVPAVKSAVVQKGQCVCVCGVRVTCDLFVEECGSTSTSLTLTGANISQAHHHQHEGKLFCCCQPGLCWLPSIWRWSIWSDGVSVSRSGTNSCHQTWHKKSIILFFTEFHFSVAKGL